MIREVTQQLLNLIARWDRRFRLQQSLVWLPRGIAAGLVPGLALAVVARLRPWLFPEQIAVVAGAAVALGVALTLLVIWMSRHDPLAMARRFDRLFGLKERVSTALELAAGGIRSPNPEITTRLLSDTLARARRIDARAYLPLRPVRRDLGIVAALLLALVLLLVLDNPQAAVLAEQQALQEAIQEQVAELENLRDDVLQNSELDDVMREDLLEALDDAIETLSQEDLSQEEAVATLSELGQNLADLSDSAQMTPAQQQAFERAAEQLAEQAEDVASALQEGDLGQAADAMESLANEVGGMEQAAQQALSDSLQQAADELSETNPELAESLQQAADALEQGDTEAAQQALEDAAGQLQQQDQELARSENDTGRRLASQAAEQANASAQQLAQQGSAQSPTGESVEQPQGDSPASGAQEGTGGAENQLAQPGQGGSEGDQSQIGGEGTGAGNESSQTVTEGSGAAGGAGEGTSSGEEGGFEAGGEQIAQDNNPDGSGQTDYEPIFVPQRIGGEEGPQVQVPGSNEPGNIVVQEGNLTEGPEGESLVGYDEVFSDYANAANEALTQDYIPLGLRDVVHDYFSSLEP